MDVGIQPAGTGTSLGLLEAPAGERQPGALTGATEVHRALCVPPVLRIGGWDLASRILPQRGIAGDFIVSLDRPGGTLLAIGDLMGKGLSAAMWLTHVIDLVRRSAEPFDSVPGVLARLNLELHRSRVGAPLTSLCLLDLEPAAGRLTFASAGHPPALLLTARGEIRMLSQGGPLLGAFSSATYDAAELHLGAGDCLVAFSDGLADFRNHLGQEFGVDGVVRCLRGRRRQHASDIADGLLACSHRFAGRTPSDDVTVLVLKRS